MHLWETTALFITASMPMFPMNRATAATSNVLQYSETVTASGTLNHVAFSNATFTLETSFAISAVSSNAGGTNFHSSSSIVTTFNIAGVGSGVFDDPTDVFANQNILSSPNSGAVGFTNSDPLTGAADILDILSPALHTYDLQSQIGPIVGTPVINASSTFSTSAGQLQIASVSSGVTFSAVPVPEPSTFAALVVAGTALVNSRFRQNRFLQLRSF